MEKECREVSSSLSPVIQSVLANYQPVSVDPKESGIESSKDSGYDTAYKSSSHQNLSGFGSGKTNSATGVQESLDSSYRSFADKLQDG
jgi:hypothetical protein